MANWSDLKAAVASIVKTNGNKEITGQLLQDALNNIISNVGLNSSFAGIATPETNPGTPDGNVFYLATTAGTYSNFNGILIEEGEAVILEWRGSWTKKNSGFATQENLSKMQEETEEKLSELGSELSIITENISNQLTSDNSAILTDGSYVWNQQFKSSSFIPIEKIKDVSIYLLNYENGFPIAALALYDSEDYNSAVYVLRPTGIGEYVFISIKRLLEKYSTAKFVKICQRKNENEISLVYNTIANPIFNLSDRVSAIEGEIEISNLNGSSVFTIDNYGIYDNGQSYWNTSQKMSDFLPLSALKNKTVKIYYNTTFHSIALYSEANESSCIYTSPREDNRNNVIINDLIEEYPSAKYLRMCQSKSIISDFSIVNSNIASFVYGSIPKESLIEKDIVLKRISNRMLLADGSIYENNNYAYDDTFYHIDNSVKVKTKFKTLDAAKCCIYNKDKTVIGAVNCYENGTIDLSAFSECAYIRFSYIYNDSLEHIAVIQASSTSSFAASILADSYRTEENIVYHWNLPISLTVNNEYIQYFYKDTMVALWDMMSNVDIIVNSTDCGYREDNEKIWVTCNGTYIEFALVKSEKGRIETLSVYRVEISQKEKLSSVSKNVLFIGDSYIDNQYGGNGIIGKIDELAKEMGNVIIPIGSKKSYGYNTEARAGWSADDFVKDGSPFIFNGEFDFERYCSENNIIDMDCVVFFLGMNAGDPYNVGKMLWGGSNVAKSITDVFPNVKIVISHVPSYFGHTKYSAYDKATNQWWNRITYNERTNEMIRNHVNVFISPINGYNRIYGYRCATDLYYNQFSNDNIEYDVALPETRLVNYDHHPSSYGCKVIAYCLYNMIF